VERYVDYRTQQTSDPGGFQLPSEQHPGMVARLRRLVVEHAGARTSVTP
jgi:hypothetical protein